MRTLAITLCLLLLGSNAACADTGYPTAGQCAKLEYLGRPLADILPELSKQFGVKLAASPRMGGQRVTLIAPAIRLDTLARGLETLLSASESARVTWHSEDTGAMIESCG